MTLKKLSELQVFSGYPAPARKAMIDEMSSVYSLEELQVREHNIQEQMATIRRRFKYASKNMIFNALEDGTLIAYMNENTRVASSIPSWLIYSKGRVRGVTNLSFYAKRLPNGEIEIESKRLYGLLQNGIVTKAIYENYKKLTSSTSFVKNITKAYTKMFVRCLDRLYSVGLNKVEADKTAYMVAIFFQVHVLGKTLSPVVRDIAFSCTINDTPRDVFNNAYGGFDESLSKENFDGFPALMDVLSNNVASLTSITLRSVLETWTRFYGDSMMLAIESFQIFVGSIFAAFVSAGLNSENVVISLVEPQIKKAYIEFFRMCK